MALKVLKKGYLRLSKKIKKILLRPSYSKRKSFSSVLIYYSVGFSSLWR